MTISENLIESCNWEINKRNTDAKSKNVKFKIRRKIIKIDPYQKFVYACSFIMSNSKSLILILIHKFPS